MFPNIENFLNKNRKKIKQHNWQKPLILDWLHKDKMKKSLAVMDKKVDYLLKNKAIHKLRQWFLSDDRDFNCITAERYIIDYLKSKNRSMKDNLSKSGIDAIYSYSYDGHEVGIEVTTINGFIANWIFTERLRMYLEEKEFLDIYTLEINYEAKRIINEMQKNSIYIYVQNVGDNIILNSANTLKSLEIKYCKANRQTGSIVWNCNKIDDSSSVEYLIEELIKILKRKVNQLSKYCQNLIFVGVNHEGPTNWINPDIFEEMGGSSNIYQQQIQMIQDFLSKNLPQNVLGVCYFIYQLDKDEPFYPLRIFWRDEKNKIMINL
jgi:hypothetical protein